MEHMEEKTKIPPAGPGGEEERQPSIEELFQDLEEILDGMEDPEIPLEKAFALYEQGMKKVRQCNEKLDMVEKQMLVIENDGEIVPFA